MGRCGVECVYITDCAFFFRQRIAITSTANWSTVSDGVGMCVFSVSLEPHLAQQTALCYCMCMCVDVIGLHMCGTVTTYVGVRAQHCLSFLSAALS